MTIRLGITVTLETCRLLHYLPPLICKKNLSFHTENEYVTHKGLYVKGLHITFTYISCDFAPLIYEKRLFRNLGKL